MTLSQGKLRVMLRWTHIIIGLILLCYIYSPLGRIGLFQMMIKIVLIPILVLSGVWLWKFTNVNKLFGIK